MERFENAALDQLAEDGADFAALQRLLAAAPPSCLRAEGERSVPPAAAHEENSSRPGAPLSLLPMLQDVAALIGEVIKADLTGASEVVENRTMISRAVGAAWEDGGASQTIVRASSPGLETSLSAYVLTAGNTITSADLVVEGRFGDEFLRGLGVRSAIGLPLRLHDKTVATLEVYRLRREAFSPHDIQFLEVMTRQICTLVRQVQDEHTARTKEDRQARKQGGDRRQGAELRSSVRRRFPYRQMIAPLAGEQLPSKVEFFPVWCRDLSSGGLSIYLESPPAFHNLVVALGPPSQLKYFRAEVMHVQSVDHEGQKAYLIGCRLNERVYL